MNDKASHKSIIREHILNLMKLVPMYLFMISIIYFLTGIAKISFPVRIYYLYAGYTMYGYFIRYSVHKIIPYFCLHLVIFPALFLCCHNPLLIGFSLLYFVVLFIYGYYFWAYDVIPLALAFDPALVLAILFFYIAALHEGARQQANMLFFISILFMLFSYIASFIKNTQLWVKINAENSSISAKIALRRNAKITLTLLIVIFGMAFLLNTPFLQDILLRVYHFIGDAIRYLLQQLFKGADQSSNVAVTSDPLPSFEQELPPTNPPSLLVKILNMLLIIFSNALLIFIPLFLIYKLIRFIISNPRKKHEKEHDLDKLGIEEVRTKLDRPKKKARHVRLHHKNESERIRYMYYKTIMSYTKHGYEINKTHTPLEREEDVEAQFSDDITELTSEYEKARYGKPSE